MFVWLLRTLSAYRILDALDLLLDKHRQVWIARRRGSRHREAGGVDVDSQRSTHNFAIPRLLLCLLLAGLFRLLWSWRLDACLWTNRITLHRMHVLCRLCNYSNLRLHRPISDLWRLGFWGYRALKWRIWSNCEHPESIILAHRFTFANSRPDHSCLVHHLLCHYDFYILLLRCCWHSGVKSDGREKLVQ